MPRPPQTESMSTPSVRAACRTGVPTGKRPRRPAGVKTTVASATAPPSLAAAARRLALGAGGAGRRLLAELLEPAHAMGVVAHQRIGGQHRAQDLVVAGVGDRGGHAGTDRHGEKGRVDAAARGQAEADIGGAAAGVDLELLAEPANDMERSE